jgi:hypothetical protein
MSAPQMRSPAPRWSAGNRAEVIRNETSHSIARTEPEADFAAIYLARRFGLAIPLAFKVNRFNGRWCDFATDVVSLVAYLEGVSQGEAARRLARMLGLEIGGRRHG